jgi:hypothetical protein
VHDSQKFDGLLNQANTSKDVYADSAYRSAETEAKLGLRGLRSRIHHRASRNHPLYIASWRPLHCAFSGQYGRASATMIPHLVQTMRGPNAGTGGDPATARRLVRIARW